MKKVHNEEEVKEVKHEHKHKVSEEEQLHIDAREARVKKVKDDIEAAKVVREEQEKLGVTETEGAKLDRLAKEKKDLEEASVLNKIELLAVTVDFGRTDLNETFNKVVEK